MNMNKTNKHKRGIALVVVLGLLALLLMMAVAFSIFMRTERHAAGGFQHDVRARLLLQAAAARALEALDANLADRYYPEWVVLSSTNASGSVVSSLSTNQAWAAHLPGALLNDPALQNAMDNVGWLSVPGGRIGYMIVNASGLLDVNKAGGGTREFGLDPDEIDLTALAEVSSVASLTAPPRNFDSVRELKKGVPANGLQHVSHFVTYSRSPTNEAGLAPVELSGSDLTPKRGVIIDTLKARPFEFLPAEAADVADALIDYVDPDSVPQRLDAPCMERAPMFNEILIRPRWVGARSPRPSKLDLTPRVEVFYPFITTRGTLPFTLEGEITFVCSKLEFPPPGLAEGDFPLPGTGGKVTFSGISKSLLLSYGHLEFGPLPEMSTIVDTSVWAGATAYFKVTVSLTLKDTAGKAVDSIAGLDITMGRPAPPAPLYAWQPYARIPGPGESAVVQRSGVECVDPRFNHLTGQGVAWFSYAMLEAPPGRRGGEGFPAYPSPAPNMRDPDGTLGDLNRLTERWLAKQMATTNYSTDGHTFMHVADQPLVSAGELSYLPRGGNVKQNFWNTLRLIPLGSGATELADPIYDYFTVSPPTATQRGFVNPNTDILETMDAVFKNMPLDAYPGEPGAPLVNPVQARQLANALLSGPLWAVGGYSNKSDIVKNTNYVNALSALVSSETYKEFRQESGIRNLLGLLNARQNYFLIVLFAQSSAQVRLARSGDTLGGMMDTVRSDSSALLEVWRDPKPVLTNLGGGTVMTNHPLFIRRFEVLAEE